jgi:hypothetical protein
VALSPSHFECSWCVKMSCAIFSSDYWPNKERRIVASAAGLSSLCECKWTWCVSSCLSCSAWLTCCVTCHVGTHAYRVSLRADSVAFVSLKGVCVPMDVGLLSTRCAHAVGTTSDERELYSWLLLVKPLLTLVCGTSKRWPAEQATCRLMLQVRMKPTVYGVIWQW